MYTRVQYINHEKADIDAVFTLAVNAIVDGYIWVVRIAPCSSVGRAIDCRGTDINRSLVRFQSGRFCHFYTSSHIMLLLDIIASSRKAISYTGNCISVSASGITTRF